MRRLLAAARRLLGRRPGVRSAAASPRATVSVAPTPPPITSTIQPGQLSGNAHLGQGGQGIVRDVLDDPTAVMKEYTRPVAGGVSGFKKLAAHGPSIQGALNGSRIDLAWPESAIELDGALSGYRMPKIPERFWFEADIGPRKKRLRTLDFAVPRTSAIRVPFAVSADHRLELVQLVAEFLLAMHKNGLVYGDLSWTNFAFSLHPVELSVHDFDSSRKVGARSFTGEAAAQTPDWWDPETPNPRVAALDGDRFKFALLAFRLLVSQDLHSALDISLLDARGQSLGAEVLRLRPLWVRASFGAGGRPQVCEWLAVLGDPPG